MIRTHRVVVSAVEMPQKPMKSGAELAAEMMRLLGNTKDSFGNYVARPKPSTNNASSFGAGLTGDIVVSTSQGIVEGFEPNKQGDPRGKVRIAGSWYYSGSCDVSGMVVGTPVEVEWKSFGQKNNLKGIQNWGNLGQGQQVQQNPLKNSWGSPGQQNLPTQNPPQAPPRGLDEPQLRLVSNVLGNLANRAGMPDSPIQKPSDLESWYIVLKDILLGKPRQAPKQETEEEFDDKIPF